MGRRCFITALVFLIASAASAVGQTTSKTAIKEAGFVKIGGIEQWITISGDDTANPVVLILHGGPSDALSPYAEGIFGGWERDFVMVQWDQRGSGRTYGKSGPTIESTMSIERMVQDGIEVSEYLTSHLHKKKIIIVGGSWGSILGIYMAHARSDLFYAYVGQAQIVNWWQNVAASYARVMELARNAHDQQAIADLTALGPPPWNSLSQWPKFRKYEQFYQSKIASSPPKLAISPAYASPLERAQWHAADDNGWVHFVGLDFAGPLTKVDLPALGTNFSIPIFMIQGDEDLTAVPELAKSYFDRVVAPVKQFYTVPDTGHEPSAALLDLTRKVLLEKVRPLIASN